MINAIPWYAAKKQTCEQHEKTHNFEAVCSRDPTTYLRHQVVLRTMYTILTMELFRAQLVRTYCSKHCHPSRGMSQCYGGNPREGFPHSEQPPERVVVMDRTIDVLRRCYPFSLPSCILSSASRGLRVIYQRPSHNIEGRTRVPASKTERF